ncbi:HD domain-containing protein [Bradyrhizobium ottawaense]|uniref:HD domain-containing protein n=1 Tax=Bradyrhizobium ottawaense TaxID=931866 RepID=A0A2U8PGG5_9BRAD|nr:HD domain-containing protein [Bradyrhizobium ottawaense]AWL96818.1 HD domain-containing protein [Bradyrhizobium ottawaense]
MYFLDRRLPRPITDALRATVLEDLPELAHIRDDELRRKAIEAWAYALAETDFPRLTAIPGEATPGVFALKRGSQAVHLRSVARIAMAIADDFAQEFPETTVDCDIVLAGALLHDVGKAWEFDPANRRRWDADKSQAGSPALRHPVYGAHVCIAVGLPEEIAHIALGHSYEGDLMHRSLECLIVHRADHMWWSIAGGFGLLKPETAGMLESRKISPRALRPAKARERQDDSGESADAAG